MKGRKAMGVAIEGGVVVFVVAMVAGQVLGTPVLLGYVTTGSMAPTLDVGDGFVAVPAELAGDVERGDVVTFRAEHLHGGGLTTHRVVETTDRGFVTKGDANPFTDQDGEEPPVKREQVVSVAWQPGGGVLAIPGVGTLVGGITAVASGLQTSLARLTGSRSLLGAQGLTYLVFAGSVLWYLAETYRDRSGGRERARARDRSVGSDPRYVLAGLAMLVVASATVTMIAPGGAQQFGVVSAETDAPGSRVIERGTNESLRYPVGNDGLVPVVAFVDPGGDGVAVEDGEQYVRRGEVANATVTLSAPPETGYYRRYVTEHRYLALLPRGHIRGLYEVHPWLPIVAIDALLGATFYLGGAALVGRGRLRERSRERPGDRLSALRGWFS